jgi:hypothetical protein
MVFRLGELGLRATVVLAVTCLLLVPTGVCLCAHEEGTAEDHQPGCPEVRQLDRSGPVAHYGGDDTSIQVAAAPDDDCPAGPPRVVARVNHGPPRGQPLYLTHQTLLI